MCLTSVTSTNATCLGQVIQVTTDPDGNPVTPFWYPHAPGDVTKFGYTLHIESDYASVEEVEGEFIISCYPNPTESSLNIGFTLDESADITIHITDLSGAVVQNQELKNYSSGQQNLDIDVESLANGMYSIEIIINEETYRKKFIKQ